MFTVENVKYTNNPETGLFWGFHGRIGTDEVRYFDHALADGDALGHQGIHRMFPTGTVFYLNTEALTILRRMLLKYFFRKQAYRAFIREIIPVMHMAAHTAAPNGFIRVQGLLPGYRQVCHGRHNRFVIIKGMA